MFSEERAAYGVADEPRPFRRVGLGYVFEPCNEAGVSVGVRFLADNAKRRSGGMFVELTVESTLPGIPQRIYNPSNCNLLAPNSLRDIAKDLAEVTGIGPETIPWRRFLGELSNAIIEADRTGEPFECVSDEPPTSAREYVVPSLIPIDMPTLLYAPWASGKGWMACGIALSVATGLPFAGLQTKQGAVGYLDWEDTKKNFDGRMWALMRGMGLTTPPKNLHYRHCQGSLSGQVNQIARYVAEHRITLLVLDSVGLAGGTPGEMRSYEETALTLFDGLRHIGATQLLIDHVSEEGRQNKQLVGKSYGSIYKMALVRNAWEVRKEQTLEAHTINLGLYHTKCNHGPLLRPIGLRIQFDGDEVTRIAREDLSDPALSARLPGHERIAMTLADRGPLSVKDIALAVDLPQNQVRTYLDRHEKLFFKLSDGRWRNRGETNGRMTIVTDEFGQGDTDDIPF